MTSEYGLNHGLMEHSKSQLRSIKLICFGDVQSTCASSLLQIMPITGRMMRLLTQIIGSQRNVANSAMQCSGGNSNNALDLQI
jgi:ornithine carbamoyltransferase